MAIGGRKLGFLVFFQEYIHGKWDKEVERIKTEQGFNEQVTMGRLYDILVEEGEIQSP